MSKGYAVTVEGLYMVDGGHGRKSEKKKYKIVVNVAKYADDTLSIIKNRLLDSAVRKFDPNYKTYLTHSITGVQALGENAGEGVPNRLLTPDNMSVNQLVNYVRGKKLPVALHLYTGDILKFRQAISSCEADLKKFLAGQVALQEDFEVQKELQELNPELEAEGKVTIDKDTVANCKPVSLPAEAFAPKQEVLDDEVVKKATEEAQKPQEEVAQEQDETYLTDGSESFSRDSEAPFPDDIDDEVASGKDVTSEQDVASILAANETKEPLAKPLMVGNDTAIDAPEDLVGDL
jgi:DNA-binding protein YbaB